MVRGFFYLLIFVRLLWPPGICACHLFDAEPAHHDHEEHAPGCPASKMALTQTIMKQDASQPPDAPTLAVTLPEPQRAVAADGPDASQLAPPAPSWDGPPLYLTLRALRI
jgi:hypothetical protein